MPSKTHFGLTNMRRYYSLFLLFFLLFIISIHYSFGSAQKEEDQEEEVVKEEQLQMESRTSIIETVKRMFSFPTSLVPQTSNSYWSKFESFIKQSKAYFSPPPTLDFRESQEAQAREEGGARGEKVKEAVLKSLDKSKATMEESAKSAARLAGDAVQKTKNKVKRTFSFRHREPDPGHQADEL